MITKKLKSLLDAITEAIRKSAPEFTVYILGQDEEPPDETYYFLIKFEKCNLKMIIIFNLKRVCNTARFYHFY